MICTKVDSAELQLTLREQQLADQLGLPRLVMAVLVSRGMTDPKKIEIFLKGRPDPFYDPFLLSDMERAVQRILKAVKSGEKITIYGDYDVDGTTGSSLLYLYLKELGADVSIYIPRRDSEGYGLNLPALQKIAAGGTTLMVTVDTGITGAEVTAQAPKSMDIIVTDHHLPPTVLPDVCAVVNPNRPGDKYPCKSICGACVAFKLCQALQKAIDPSGPYWHEYIELAAVATVADVVPLVDENREIVRIGLAKIRRTKLVGLQALLDSCISKDARVTSETIGFGIGPRINAAGRLGDAMDAVRLLLAKDPEEAKRRAHFLNEENAKRQDLSQKIFEEAEMMLAEPGSADWAIVLAKEGWHPGVIGIVASRLVEKYHVPAILMSLKDGVAHGSCRSIPPIHLYNALASCSRYMVQFGGHAQAAGLTIEEGQIASFREAFKQTVAELLHNEPYEPVVTPDLLLADDETLTVRDVEALDRLAPFGAENEAPVLGFTRAQITRVSTMGKEKNHLRLDLRHAGQDFKGLVWKEGPSSPYFYSGEIAKIAFAPRLNTFRGITSVDLEVKAVETPHMVVDWRYSSKNKETLLNTILQKDKKTVTYKGDNSSVPPSMDGTVLNYGDPLPVGTRTVVFYDAGAAKVLTPTAFPLLNGQAAELHLLFNRDELVARREAVMRKYPDLVGMRYCYLHILHLLQAEGHVSREYLLGQHTREGYEITSDVLDVFLTLGLLIMREREIYLGKQTKKDMVHDVGFMAIQEKREEALRALNRLWHISAEEIAEIWNQRR
ncbi:MAG: single-stranded-DNA-specific exonuclease RecJ [Acidaminococcus sp.]|jgi:single-stranded-DNA-specific exonuclease|nr:single-stranded-DNA-specific exonuclease RecJ [Acidaminococcus sp.]MCI2100133.1 single-stranded-DNA-specific exonuclease RecJ [Acidaminococcus sp.]MCI2114452.1 single-stranded-DNA-specific exonuclease RecJ [Acidaminococcus sp.]MCI2116387.1 single-stranded-DNA-specific exonuclease RecJ [Acidaminococcus sp.]